MGACSGKALSTVPTTFVFNICFTKMYICPHMNACWVVGCGLIYLSFLAVRKFEARRVESELEALDRFQEEL